MNKILTINENDYIDYLRDNIVLLKNCYIKYLSDPNDINFLSIKEAIYLISCDLKSCDVKNNYSKNEIEDMNSFFGGYY